MGREILVIGAGGHCRSVIDTLLDTYDRLSIGIIDNKKSKGDKVLGVDIVGNDNDIEEFYRSGTRLAFVAIGGVGNPIARVKLFNRLLDIGFEIPSIIDKTAIVSKHTKIPAGVFIGKGALVNAEARIGKGVIINTGVIVEQQASIGDFAHISPGAVICGESTIKDFTHIGAKSVIRQRLTIGSNTLIGLGSVVVTDINDNVTAYGCPCMEVDKRERHI